MDDIMRQNPDLMSQFTKAAVSSMENTTPGLGNFMNDFRRDPKPQQRQERQYREEPRERQEMKGPRDINDLLSGLKSKSVAIPEYREREERDPSTVSISELKELNNQKQPKSNRKQSNSQKNTISLDL